MRRAEAREVRGGEWEGWVGVLVLLDAYVAIDFGDGMRWGAFDWDCGCLFGERGGGRVWGG